MFIKTFKEVCGSGASRHRIFSDWLECAAIALHQLPYHAQELEKDEAYHRLEQTYLDRIQPYKPEQLQGFSHLLSITMLALQEPCCDFLGEIYAELELAKAHAGQFFTPYPVSRTMAALCVGNLKAAIAQQGIVTIEEPAVGSGGCLIAAAQAAYEQHIDPRCSLQMRAVDIARRQRSVSRLLQHDLYSAFLLGIAGDRPSRQHADAGDVGSSTDDAASLLLAVDGRDRLESRHPDAPLDATSTRF